VKLYADEPGYREIRALQLLVVSAITRVEMSSALWRKARTRELDDSAASLLVSAFELDFHGDLASEPRFTIVSLTASALIAAARQAARHSLRAYDAVPDAV
jgi:predicted nucleic acid-binding protein